MRVLVIGGTGFIGYHIVRALQAQGDHVAVLCRDTAAASELFGDGIEALAGDVGQLQAADYVRLLRGVDGVVFAAGADERSEVRGDADTFFHEANVRPCAALFAAAAEAGVRRAVLLNSIFAWLDREEPALALAKRHPYIRSRVEQDRVAHAAVASSDTVLVTLHVPWVFGAAPHRESQWSALVNYVRAGTPLMCIRGGASMLSVQSLAQAVCGALRYPQHSVSLPVGDENLSYVQLMQRLCPIVGRKDCRVRPVSDGFFRDITSLGHFVGVLFGKQAGIELNGMAELLFREIFIDSAAVKAQLHYEGGDLDAALREMVAIIPENALLGSWRKSLNWFSRE